MAKRSKDEALKFPALFRFTTAIIFTALAVTILMGILQEARPSTIVIRGLLVFGALYIVRRIITVSWALWEEPAGGSNK